MAGEGDAGRIAFLEGAVHALRDLVQNHEIEVRDLSRRLDDQGARIVLLERTVGGLLESNDVSSITVHGFDGSETVIRRGAAGWDASTITWGAFASADKAEQTGQEKP